MTRDTGKTVNDPAAADPQITQITPNATNIFLGLGSNLGDREANLHGAVDRVTSLGLGLVQASSIYETEPVGHLDQPWFLNQVIEMREEPTAASGTEPSLSIKPIGGTGSDSAARAARLLDALLRIEADMGRERSLIGGPRVIDIDLLLFGELILAGATIAVPHPRMHLRRFVLEPLCEIAGALVHPVLKKSYWQLLAEVEDKSAVRRHS